MSLTSKALVGVFNSSIVSLFCFVLLLPVTIVSIPLLPIGKEGSVSFERVRHPPMPLKSWELWELPIVGTGE